MATQDKNSLKNNNDSLYSEATSAVQKVTSPNQQTVTNNQIDSFVAELDRRQTISETISKPVDLLNIILDYTNNDQFILDLTAMPETTFNVSSIIGVESGQSVRLQILRTGNQTITLANASGSDINELNNPLEITGINSPVQLFYSSLDAKGGIPIIPQDNLYSADSDGNIEDSGISKNSIVLNAQDVIRQTSNSGDAGLSNFLTLYF